MRAGGGQSLAEPGSFDGRGLARGYRIAAGLTDGCALLLLALFLTSAFRDASNGPTAGVHVLLGVVVALAVHVPARVLRQQAHAAERSSVRLGEDGVYLRLPTPERFVRGRGPAEEVFVRWAEIEAVSRVDLPLALPLELGPIRLLLKPHHRYRAYAIDTRRGRILLMPAALPEAAKVARSIAERAAVPFRDTTSIPT